jgi:conjugative relaxase-like TrwC/TraI family protein
MMSVKISISAKDAESYYGSDDYYIGADKSEGGYWYGNDEMAESFGLVGSVKPESFSKILGGYDPISGAPVAANAGDKNRCAGSDFTFSVPKSVSILAFKDKEIEKAFDRTVHKSLDYLESFIQTRHKHNGVVTHEKTGRALFAVFKHTVSRAPDSTHEPDPQLHAHCVMPNLTVDADRQFMAIHNPFADKNMIHLLGQYFRNELAEELKELGYSIDITDRKNGFFEVKGISKEIIKTFSNRADQVKTEVENLRKLTYKDIYETDKAQLMKWAKERVRTADPAAVDVEFERLRNSNELPYANWSDSKLTVLAVKTSRQRKRSVKKEDIINQINDTLTEKHGETLDSLITKAKAEQPKPPDPDNTPRRAILAAIENATTTEVAYTKEEIIRNALRLNLGGETQPKAVIAEFDRLIGTKITKLRTETSKKGEITYYSTPELMDIERENIDICVKSKTNYVIDNKTVDEFINQTHKELIRKPDGTGFTQGQADALRHILTTDCQYSAVQGDAGTGKSFSMRYAKELLEKHGYEVCGVAPTGKATDELAAAAGIKTIMTIDSLIKTADKPLKRGKKYCFIVDESSMGGSRTINELLKVTQEYDAKVIFVGDKKQFQPVGAGKFFSDLQKTDVKVTHMKDVVRQKTAQTRNVVKALADKEIHEAFNHLAGHTGYKNCIQEIKDGNARQQAVADDYVNCYNSGTDAIVVTATNEDRRSINKIIREKLVNQGKIKNIGEFPLLEPQNIGDFLYADSFSIGQQIKGLPQLKVDGKSEFGVITDIDRNRNRITVYNPITQESFPIHTPDYAGKPFSVFNHNEKAALGIGEKIAFLKNAKVTDKNTGKTVNLRNGQLAAITALDKEGNISVNMGNKDIKFNLNDYNYLTTAFALSLHKSQGMTVDKVIWHADSQKEVSTNSIYVAITRCKRDIAVYTDDAENLRKKAAKEQDKYSTMDDEFEEDYNKTYKKHLEAIQKRKQKDAAPETVTPEAAPPIQETAPTPTIPAAAPSIQAVKPPAAVKTSPPATAAAPAVQAVKPRPKYNLKTIDGYNVIPRHDEDLRTLSLNNIAKMIFPPKSCDTFDAIRANIQKIGLAGFIPLQRLNLWKRNFDEKDNKYKTGTQAMRCVIAAARELQINGVSIDNEAKQGDIVYSVSFKPDKKGCFGLDVVKEADKDGKPNYAVIMKYPAGDEFARKKERVFSLRKMKLPILHTEDRQTNVVGYMQKNGEDVKIDMVHSEWVYKDEKDNFPTILTALRACIPEHVEITVHAAIRNIVKEKEYSNVPELKKPEKTVSSGWDLTD